MRAVALALAYWACSGSGRRLPTIEERIQMTSNGEVANPQEKDEIHTRMDLPQSLTSLAMLLSAFNPASARQAMPARHKAPPLMQDAATVPEIDFTNLKWAILQKHLDTLPVWAIVTEDMKPIAYEHEGKPLQIFFVDHERAKQELFQVSEKFDMPLYMNPAGLGQVFRMHTEGSALLVPSNDSLAGVPDGWNSEILPLYTCFQMQSKSYKGNNLEGVEHGELCTPLFLCPNDARKSLEKCITDSKNAGMSEDKLSQLQLACCAMPTAVSLILNGKEEETLDGGRFQFVAPKSSLLFLKKENEEGEAEAKERIRSTMFPMD